jgi:thymidylate synthase
MVSAWNVGELDKMVLPPCHYGFQLYTRELTHQERIGVCLSERPESKFAAHVDTNETLMNDWGIPKRAISLIWNQRSVDTFLGLPFNLASYGLLLHILANEMNMIPDELIGNLGDTHLYSNHIEQAKEQISRESFDLPKLKTNVKIDGICCATPDDFILDGYQYHPTIKAPLSN